ncbi:MAG: xanthine dehydrogenase accessory protein XdhC [Thiolinea sp.]
MKRFVIVTVLETKGSAPRDAGTKMLISADGTLGTIGGGMLEYQAMQTSRELLTCNTPTDFTQQQTYVLGTQLGQCCGGQVQINYQITDNTELWQDPLQANNQQFNIVLFGAGHVGQAIVNILQTQPCQVHWVDSRETLFPGELPANVTRYTPDTPASLIQEMPANSYFLVMTHDHALDLELCDHILSRQEFRFLGLIGSETKATRFKRQLLRRGLVQQDIDRLTCPIGISGIESKLPSSIAVAVVAQLVGLQEKDTPSSRGVRVGNHSANLSTKFVPRPKEKSPLPPLSNVYKAKRLNQRGVPSRQNVPSSKGLPLCKRGNEGDLNTRQHQDSIQ